MTNDQKTYKIQVSDESGGIKPTRHADSFLPTVSQGLMQGELSGKLWVFTDWHIRLLPKRSPTSQKLQEEWTIADSCIANFQFTNAFALFRKTSWISSCCCMRQKKQSGRDHCHFRFGSGSNRDESWLLRINICRCLIPNLLQRLRS